MCITFDDYITEDEKDSDDGINKPSLHEEFYDLHKCTFNVTRAHTLRVDSKSFIVIYLTSIFQKTHYMYFFQKIDRDKLDVSYFESVSSSKSAYYAIEADNIHNLVENQILEIRDSDGNLNLFFGLTVDVGGLLLYKSSPSDIWPILIAVNNLDLVLPNVVLNIGKKKPDFFSYPNPFIEEISVLKSQNFYHRGG